MTALDPVREGITAMIRIQQGVQRVHVLVMGGAAGCLLALLSQAHRGSAAPALAMVVFLLPFILAALTGVAKTTTA